MIILVSFNYDHVIILVMIILGQLTVDHFSRETKMYQMLRLRAAKTSVGSLGSQISDRLSAGVCKGQSHRQDPAIKRRTTSLVSKIYSYLVDTLC